MKGLVVLLGALGLVLGACRHTLEVPWVAVAPKVDGLLEDWTSLATTGLAQKQVELLAVQDGSGLVMQLRLMHPALAQALRQGRLELRLGQEDARGRQRALGVLREEWPGMRLPPAGHDAGKRGDQSPAKECEIPAGFRSLTWIWLLRGEDYRDERHLPMAQGKGPRVAWCPLGAEGGGAVEVELPNAVLGELCRGSSLQVELGEVPSHENIPGIRTESRPQGGSMGGRGPREGGMAPPDGVSPHGRAHGEGPGRGVPAGRGSARSQGAPPRLAGPAPLAHLPLRLVLRLHQGEDHRQLSGR